MATKPKKASHSSMPIPAATKGEVLRPAVVAAQEKRKITNRELATAAKTSEAKISMFKRGMANLRSDTIDRILTALDIRFAK